MPDTKGSDRAAAGARPTRTRRNGYDSEDAFQKAAAAFLNAALPSDCWWCHVPNAGKRNLIEGSRLKKMGMKAGAPDCLIIWRGLAHWIELKTRYGTLQDSQKIAIPRIAAAGAPVVIARTLADIVSALETWGIPISPANKLLASRRILEQSAKPTLPKSAKKTAAAATAGKTGTPKTELPQRMSAAQFKAVMGLGGDATTERASWHTTRSAPRRKPNPHAKPVA